MRSLFKTKSFYLVAITSSLIIILGVVATIYFLKKSSANAGNPIQQEHISLTGNLHLQVFHADKPEKGLVIYITDKHAHNNDYAKKYADLSYYVATIDSQILLASTDNQCINLAKKLADIAKELQTHYDIDDDQLPILAGNDEGATAVYIALAQAEKNTFHAGVSINFSVQIPESKILLCSPNNPTESIAALPSMKHLPASWYIFQDKSFAQHANSNAFINQVNNARLTISDGSNQTTLSESIQILQWLDPRLTDQISSDSSDSDLPLIEVPVPEEHAQAASANTLMAVLLTGDGGWAEIDKNVANILAEKGIPTVAFDSLSYFWKARTPIDTAKDIEDVITQYREKWQKKDVILIGYSFGADVLPFIANKLTPDTQKNIALVALLGMGKTAAFEFRLSSWMNADKASDRMPLPPEIKNMSWANSVCIYGQDDPDSSCKEVANLGVKIISMTGDHHFDEKYDELVNHIVANAKLAEEH